MGCSGSKNAYGSQASRPQQYQQQPPQYQLPQVQYGLPQNTIPPSTLPQGWISQYDTTKQRLFYVYPQTNHVTWAHPLGPAADAQEQARFHQIIQMQQQRYGGSTSQQGFYESYNRQGGMGAGAAMALGVVGGAAMGMMAGSMLGHGMYGPGFYGDTVPASVTDANMVQNDIGGDTVAADSFFSGGGDFGGGDFGGF